MIPKTAIVTGKYASQGEYVYANTNAPYVGYYYELAGKKFAGKEYSVDAQEIIKPTSTPQNVFLRTPATSLYSLISNGLLQIPQSISFLSTPSDADFSFERYDQIVFFCKKINDPSVGIKEIDEQTYLQLKNNPLYQTTYIGDYNGNPQTPEDASKQIEGLISFLYN